MSTPHRPTRTAWILAVGSELAGGESQDTNSRWIASRLAELGFLVQRHVTVADDARDLRAVLTLARDAGINILIITGGLGPTADDITRQALAYAAGETLVTDPQALTWIREFFAARRREMPPDNEIQAQRPRSAALIHNPTGTAPGLQMNLGAVRVFSLPGVPTEMERMMTDSVLPALAELAAGRATLCRSLHCVGAPEAAIGAKIRDFMERGRNPDVGTTVACGEVGIRMRATADSRAEAVALLDRAEATIRDRLGNLVYGRDDETLASAVGNLLLGRRANLAVAESCTGGMIAALLTDAPGSSRYFHGGVVAYANAVKIAALAVSPATLDAHGAVSEAVAIEMARGVQHRLGADYGISVTGIAGPGGGSAEKPVGLAWIGLATPAGASAREYHFGHQTPRGIMRERAARAALNLLRLELLG